MNGKITLLQALVWVVLITLSSVRATSYLTGGDSPACWKTSPGESSASEVNCEIVDLKYVQ